MFTDAPTHCNYCYCPTTLWKPLETYPADKSCEFYSDVDQVADEIENSRGIVPLSALLIKCNRFREQYPDVPDFVEAVQECFTIFADLGTHRTA